MTRQFQYPTMLPKYMELVYLDEFWVLILHLLRKLIHVITYFPKRVIFSTFFWVLCGWRSGWCCERKLKSKVKILCPLSKPSAFPEPLNRVHYQVLTYHVLPCLWGMPVGAWSHGWCQTPHIPYYFLYLHTYVKVQFINLGTVRDEQQ